MNVVIITGASSGIGREFALQLDAGLYTVDEFWLIARREERLEELAARLDHMAKVIPMDLTSDADMDHFRKLLKKERPVIRMLINSSGYGMMGNFNRLKAGTAWYAGHKLQGADGYDLCMYSLYEKKKPYYHDGEQRGISSAAGVCCLCGQQSLCPQPVKGSA